MRRAQAPTQTHIGLSTTRHFHAHWQEVAHFGDVINDDFHTATQRRIVDVIAIVLTNVDLSIGTGILGDNVYFGADVAWCETGVGLQTAQTQHLIALRQFDVTRLTVQTQEARHRMSIRQIPIATDNHVLLKWHLHQIVDLADVQPCGIAFGAQTCFGFPNKVLQIQAATHQSP